MVAGELRVLAEAGLVVGEGEQIVDAERRGEPGPEVGGLEPVEELTRARGALERGVEGCGVRAHESKRSGGSTFARVRYPRDRSRAVTRPSPVRNRGGAGAGGMRD